LDIFFPIIVAHFPDGKADKCSPIQFEAGGGGYQDGGETLASLPHPCDTSDWVIYYEWRIIMNISIHYIILQAILR
jgi:hypothetical protein